MHTALRHADDFADDTLEDAVGVKLLAHHLEAGQMVRIEVLDRLLEHVARVLRPMRAARKLVDERRRQVVICSESALPHSHQTSSNSQNGSLNLSPSPTVGLKLGKSNMMAPLLQSAPSAVSYVTWPSRSKYAFPNLMLIPLRYVLVITIPLAASSSNALRTRFSTAFACVTGNASSSVNPLNPKSHSVP